MRLSVVGLVLVLLASAVAVQAEDGARVYLQTKPLQDEKLLVVDVNVADAVDLYSAEVQLRYDPATLEVQDAISYLEGTQNAPGVFFPSQQRFVIKNEVDPQTGVINFAVTLVHPAPAISGSGTLVTIVFKITGTGPTTVKITKADLVASDYAAIPATTEDLALDGNLQPVSSTPGTPTWSWWLMGLAALSLAVLLGWLILRRTHLGALEAASPTPRKIPTTSMTPSRSSAVLTQQASSAFNRGDVSMAYELYSRAVEQDPANAEAWLGKGLVAQQITEKRICFQRVLALDPNNATAQVELQQLSG